MKRVLILSAFMFTSFLFGQKMPFKIPTPEKLDSLKIVNFKMLDSMKLTSKNKFTIPSIMIPNAKPKNPSIYLALKGKARNDKPYHILNAIPESDRLPKK